MDVYTLSEKVQECLIVQLPGINGVPFRVNFMSLMSPEALQVLDAFTSGAITAKDFLYLMIGSGFTNAEALRCLVVEFTRAV